MPFARRFISFAIIQSSVVKDFVLDICVIITYCDANVKSKILPEIKLVSNEFSFIFKHIQIIKIAIKCSNKTQRNIMTKNNN